MFVQVIKGRTSDAAGLRRQLERWRDELKPGAIGFVGSTVGVTDDGTCICIARFADADDVAANGGRPEQDAWWSETAKYFDGEPSFVQVMEGTVTDRAKAEAMESPEMIEELHKVRPDLLGSLRVWLDGGAFVDTAYFTSEADARKGESSAEFTGPQEEYMALYGDMTFTDLRDPLLD